MVVYIIFALNCWGFKYPAHCKVLMEELKTGSMVPGGTVFADTIATCKAT